MNGLVVVDASLAFKWLVEEEHSDKADALGRMWASQGTRSAAPYFMPVEIALGARSMRVGFLLRRTETDPRLERTVDAERWAMHTIVLDRLEDVDDQVIGWLAEAYACKL